MTQPSQTVSAETLPDHVLVVEDDAVLGMVLEQALLDAGVAQVALSSSTEQAMQHLRQERQQERAAQSEERAPQRPAPGHRPRRPRHASRKAAARRPHCGAIPDKAAARNIASSAPPLDVDNQRKRSELETAKAISLFERAAAVDPYLRSSLLSWAVVFERQQEPPPEVLALARRHSFAGAAALPFPRPDPVRPTTALPAPLPQAALPAGSAA